MISFLELQLVHLKRKGWIRLRHTFKNYNFVTFQYEKKKKLYKD